MCLFFYVFYVVSNAAILSFNIPNEFFISTVTCKFVKESGVVVSTVDLERTAF